MARQDLRDRRATQARKVSLAHQAPWGRQEVPGRKASRVSPVRKDLRDCKVLKAWSDPPGRKARRATPLGQRA